MNTSWHSWAGRCGCRFIPAALVVCSTPATAGPVQLSPASDWTLQRTEDKCRLSRAFGEGKLRTTLVFEQSGPEVRFNVFAVGAPLRHVYGERITIAIGAEGEKQSRAYASGGQGKGQSPFVFLHGLAPDIDSVGGADPAELRLSGAVKQAVTFETGPLRDRLRQLQACGKELADKLGYNTLQIAQFSAMPEPKGNPGDWMSGADYPRRALNLNYEDVVRFRLTVNSSGKATDCFIENSQRDDGVFEDKVCFALLRRAEFTPAKDADGKPVAAYWSSAVRFMIDY